MTRRGVFVVGLISIAALVGLTASPALLARDVAAAVTRRGPTTADQDPAPTPSRADILAAAREIMDGAHFCAFITNGEDGQPQAREIDPFAPEDDFTVWMATKASTRKMAQVRRDPRVTLYYQAPNGAGYVTLFGRAAIVTDAAEKAARWKEAWAPLYDDRNRGDDYTLVRVTPVRLEIVSLTHGLVGDPATWRPLSVDFGR